MKFPKNEYIFLKKDCVELSMKTNNSAYHVKIIAEKDSEKPGGNNLPGYCTPSIGLLGCSNHVLFLLFRAEAVVCDGATKPSSTNILSKWNIATGVKLEFVQKPVSILTFNKFRYREGGSSEDKIIAKSEKYKSFRL